MMSAIRKLLKPDAEPLFRYPGLPDGLVVYTLADIHGCLGPLQRTLAAIEEDKAATNPKYSMTVFLGDYVDRGPNSKGVIDLLATMCERRDVVFLKGNHDAMLEEFVAGRRPLADWLPFGGADTLRSYGASPEDIAGDDDHLPCLIPQAHIEMLSRCEYSLHVEDYFFAHAGVRPGVSLEEQSQTDLMWIRDAFLNHRGPFGAVVVHGHTTVAEPEFRANRICIDTAAYMTGRLTCMRIDGQGPKILGATEETQ